MKRIPFTSIKITDGFWADKQKLNRQKTLWAVYDRFMESGRIPIMDCKAHPEFEVHHFWGSDVVKWMEGAAYLLQEKRDPAIEKALDEIITMIQEGTDADGYYNSYFNIHPELPKFSNRDMHELYSLGHMIEAAIAIHQALGDDRLMKICERNVDLVDRAFRIEKTAGFETPGHEEIELALIRLFDYTGKVKYLELSKYFVTQRGKNSEKDFGFGPQGWQSHAVITQQKEAVGHAVRAGYLYCAVADLADRTQDSELFQAALDLFDDIYEHKMYITGGIGARRRGEAFSARYHLPNEAYAETCAAIALAFFAGRLSNLIPDSRFGDVVERTLFNGILSGLSLDGESFFYENPLVIHPEAIAMENSGQISERVRVFSCSCCPPNLVRFIPSIGNFIAGSDDGRIYIHQFIPCEGSVGDQKFSIQTEYPVCGRIRIQAEGQKIAVRRPGWCAAVKTDQPYKEEKGYLYFDADVVELELDMTPIYVTASTRVADDAGRLAVMRGPVVYCLEGQDQPVSVFRCRLDPKKKLRTSQMHYGGQPVTEFYGGLPEQSEQETYDNLSVLETYGGLPVLETEGWYESERIPLYLPYQEEALKPCKLRLIPYYTFANRGADEMQVWMLKV